MPHTPLRVTVCELPDPARHPAVDVAFEAAWRALGEHVRDQRSELVLLPEMPFAPWFARERPFRDDVWRDALRAHDAWCARLGELGAPTVVVTRPSELPEAGGRRANVALARLPAGDLRRAHVKAYLPDEDGYWEASWYGPGPRRFETLATPAATVGVQICTDLWSLGDAQRLGKAGAQLLLVPRATPRASSGKWLAGGRTAGVVAGAFCLSSNRSDGGDGLFGGQGWVTDPEGEVLALTRPDAPFQTVEIDLAAADVAKGTYPRDALP